MSEPDDAPEQSSDERHDRPQNASRDSSRTIGRIMAFGAWAIVLGFGTIMAQRVLDARDQASRPIIGSTVDGSPTLTLSADRRGHFSVETLINGQPVTFLVDTGATSIALPAATAQRLGLNRGRAVEVSTAAGPAIAWTTRLNSLQVGPFQEENVTAVISPDMEGDVGLLGMNFLRHLDLLQRDGQLLLRRP